MIRRFSSARAVIATAMLLLVFVPAGIAEIDWKKAEGFWAFQKPAKQDAPAVTNPGWARRPIDGFVLARMEGEGLEPAPEADSETLVRRIAFDLTGLPPTREMHSLPYEQLVEQLLNSHGFGERMASVWLPIARYAEDQAHQVGNDVKFFYPNAFRYRRWVIGAFNRDLPYDDFIRYQIAADFYDEAKSTEAEALGFLGLGPQYYNRGRLEVMADEWEDGVDTVTRSFLALTVACARCHDHKFDPISAQDYHAMAGVFASTKIDRRKVDDGEIHVVKEGKVQDLPVFIRGDVEQKGDVAKKRFLTVLGGASFPDGSGRRNLAEAIADPNNPLTARVYVNRVWAEIFGAPLVATPSNFGAMGEEPSHPALLDDLAVRFVENGWSTKWLVRELALSATYRQSSESTTAKDSADGSNRWLSRMNRRRLSAEMLRDALLSASGQLDPAGGKSLELRDDKNRRRTVYGRISRKELDAYLAQFDYPDPNVHSARRVETTTPTQKLFLMNSPFVLKQAEAVAAHGGVDAIYQAIFSRDPTPRERIAAESFLGAETPNKEIRSRLAQALLASNAFLFRH